MALVQKVHCFKIEETEIDNEIEEEIARVLGDFFEENPGIKIVNFQQSIYENSGSYCNALCTLIYKERDL